jgi:hypothetical protein
VDGSYPGAVLGIGRSPAHCCAESGEFVEGEEAAALVVRKPADATRWVVDDHAVPFGKFENCAKHPNSSGSDTAATGTLPATALFLTRLGGLARSYVGLKTFDVTPRERSDRAPADEWFDMAFDPTAIHRQRRRLDPSLGVRHVQVAQF